MKNQARHFGRLRRAEMCTAYIFILPMFAGLLLFSIIPFIQNILYSFRKMGTFGEGTFIGLKNYQDLLKDDTFWLALQNTVFYAVVGVPLVIIFSIFLAHQINKKIRGRTIYRTLLFIPAITIPAAIGILWRWILNYQYGIFNWILEKLGFSRISWLGDVNMFDGQSSPWWSGPWSATMLSSCWQLCRALTAPIMRLPVWTAPAAVRCFLRSLCPC